MQDQRPQFRTDLVAKPVTIAATRVFELRCPSSGRTLRFSEAGYSIAYLLDGKRSLAEVVAEVHKQRSLVLTVEKLARLVEHLDALGCLVGGPVADPNLTVPYSAVLTVVLPVLGDGGIDEALATVALSAGALDEYYTIVPDGPEVVAPVKSRRKPAGQPERAKHKSSPPPLPCRAKVAKVAPLPELPPLPAWPPLENSIRQAAAASHAPLAQRSAFGESCFPLVQSAPYFPTMRARAKRASVVGQQSLWLAGGFFAAALVWASWALFRLA